MPKCGVLCMFFLVTETLKLHVKCIEINFSLQTSFLHFHSTPHNFTRQITRRFLRAVSTESPNTTTNNNYSYETSPIHSFMQTMYEGAKLLEEHQVNI